MAPRRCAIRDGEVPLDGGTAVQEDPDRPVFNGNGPTTTLRGVRQRSGESMPPEYMNRKVRVRCGRCNTVNVAVEEEGVDYASVWKRKPVS